MYWGAYCLVYLCMLSCFSCVLLFTTQWAAVHQAPLSMGSLQARRLEWVAMSFSSGSPWPRATCVSSLHWQEGFFFFFLTTSVTWQAPVLCISSSFQMSVFFFSQTICKLVTNMNYCILLLLSILIKE